MVWLDFAVNADDGHIEKGKRRLGYDQMGKSLNSLADLFIVKDSIDSGWVACFFLEDLVEVQ